MEQIYPLTEEVISRCRGMLVCIVFKNGAKQLGILESCGNGKLELNDSPFGFRRRRSLEYVDAPPEAQNIPLSAETPSKPQRSRKSKKAKAANVRKASPSPTNYASRPDNPAIAKSHSQGADTVKIPLVDIALLFLMI